MKRDDVFRYHWTGLVVALLHGCGGGEDGSNVSAPAQEGNAPSALVCEEPEGRVEGTVPAGRRPFVGAMLRVHVNPALQRDGQPRHSRRFISLNPTSRHRMAFLWERIQLLVVPLGVGSDRSPPVGAVVGRTSSPSR
jgi:hypothetical protein